MSGCHHAIRWLHIDATAGWARSVGGACSKRRRAYSTASTTSTCRQVALCSIEQGQPHYQNTTVLRKRPEPAGSESLRRGCSSSPRESASSKATSAHESDKEISPYSTRYAPSCTSFIGEASRRGIAVNTWVTRTSPRRRGAAAACAVVNTLSDPFLTLKTGRRSKGQYSIAIASVATSAVLAPTRADRPRAKRLIEVTSLRGTG